MAFFSTERSVKTFRSAALIVALTCTPIVANGKQDAFGIEAISTRADTVSGGDVLVKITYKHDNRNHPLQITLNGHDVSAVFRPGDDPDTLVGLVTGLVNGKNALRVQGNGSSGIKDETLEITSYPMTGPIFSGPHETPYICETVQSNLGPPLDADCSVSTRYDYFYRSTNGTFKTLANPLQYPADVASTTIYGGTTVPYVVRVESGTINRAIYRIAILDDPAHAAAGPWKPGAGWNRKLRYSFGGGCGFGHHQGNNQATAVLDDINLSRGFAFATSTLNVYGTACNDVLSAETALMVKEHFIEQYGVPRYTMGIGGSGGAMQQNLIAQNYPGILDGIVPGVAFPDGQTLTYTPTDCHLINSYFGNNPGFTVAQQIAVSGFLVRGSCTDPSTNWGAFHNGGTNSIYPKNCGSTIPAVLVYNPVTNPQGVRCTIFEGMANLYGRNPANGFAWRALDNVGIQYGLAAVNAGTIDAAQFLDLNQKIGGFDIDGNIVAQRTVAESPGVRAGYGGGRVFNGKGVVLPIIQNRTFLDSGPGNVHTIWHSLELRKRLLNANGSADNEIMWVTPSAPAAVGTLATARITDVMDQWLESLLADDSDEDYATKVINAKPVAAVDGCFDTAASFIAAPITFDNTGACNALYPISGNTRTVAGEPIQEDRVKCQLKPIDLADYRVAFTPQQLVQLSAAFPSGVCDYSKPGVDQIPLAGKWLTFGPSPTLPYSGP